MASYMFDFISFKLTGISTWFLFVSINNYTFLLTSLLTWP